MTKLLYCEDCGEIRTPSSTARDVRWCSCGRHAFWWEDPYRGIFRIHDIREWKLYTVYEEPPEGHEGRWPSRQVTKEEYDAWDGSKRMKRIGEPRCWVLGLHNGFLAHPDGHTKESIRQIIEATPPTYIFRTIESLILRIRPGQSSDTAYDDLPEQATATPAPG